MKKILLVVCILLSACGDPYKHGKYVVVDKDYRPEQWMPITTIVSTGKTTMPITTMTYFAEECILVLFKDSNNINFHVNKLAYDKFDIGDTLIFFQDTLADYKLRTIK